jgi:hypothetical protein
VFWAVGLLLVVSGVGAALAVYLMSGLPADPRLAGFVHSRPPVPIVFTSRSEPASFRPASPLGEGFHWPGQAAWAAREGRLRLLTPRGTVHELTWGRQLPDGGTLIDVMSPSLSPDGTRVVFAGRRATASDEPPARFRLYEVGVDGRDLRQLTGGPDDEGCVELPPLRFGPDGKLLDPATRKRIDYDDVDPIWMVDGSVMFASSRIPDLGSGHSRRATMLWRWDPAGGRRVTYTANRYNDRWPCELNYHHVVFSQWSRNQEVVAANGRDVVPFDPEHPGRTAPSDSWGAPALDPEKMELRFLVKTREPVWRPRPLFNNHVVFMTAPADGPVDPEGPPILRVAQSVPDLITNAPSCLSRNATLPRPSLTGLTWLPARDARGRLWSQATPAPCPDDAVVLAAAPVAPGAAGPVPAAYGLYLAPQSGWADGPAGTAPVELQPLFDDPDLVDGEPVAVYARELRQVSWGTAPLATAYGTPDSDPKSGLTHGFFENPNMTSSPAPGNPSQTTDLGEGPIFTPPPPGVIREIAFYAARRDRFDDPAQPRVPGRWELLKTIPITEQDRLRGWLPSGAPFVLAGRDAEGKVVHWQSPARDREGRHAEFYAIAGDHYSGVRPNGYHDCTSCHPGHSGNYPSNVAERRR